MYHIIVNKKSRSGRGEKLWPVIEGELERRRTEFRVYPTKYHGSARETAARLTAKGVWNPDDVLLGSAETVRRMRRSMESPACRM